MNTRLYYYRLLLADGRTKTGISWFMVERDFSAQLWLERRHKAVVLALYRFPGWLNNILRFLGDLFSPTINTEDLSGLLRDLSLMLRSGIPIIDGLRTIAAEVRFGTSSGTASVATLLYEELEGGATVSQVFARHPDLFPEIVCNLVDIGNESGTLDRMFMEASSHLERISSMRRNAKRALIYPIFVFSAIIGAAAFWLYYVIPNLSELFRQLHAKMPPLTLSVIRFSEWLSANITLSLLIFLAIFIVPWLVFKYSKRARVRLYSVGHRLPISGVLLRTSGMAFLTEHLALLIRAGLDMAQSLKILERATNDEYYKESLGGIRSVIERGERLSVAMRTTERFPPLALRMIAVGEDTGTLDEQLEHLAAEYRRRLDHLISSLSEIIKPAVIILAGFLFIFIVVVLLLPVYDLIQQSMAIPGA
ncbi:MAG: type II secretion system F family protein [Burkholderiales bacterium]|jgi:general secretion pathway protein F/type IV pilus assembly protein PilC|nr:type II secretion system F family protein [Burkholderiales bacterium]